MIDTALYLNLDHRKDRKKSILKNIKKLPIKNIIRIPAYYDPLNGTKGCLISHITALNYAKKINSKNTLILEDDCIFTKDKKKCHEYIKTSFHIPIKWDIYFLGTNVLSYKNTSNPIIKKVEKSLCAHAYIIKDHYINILLKCFQETYDIIKKDVFFTQSYYNALDRSWHKLQKKDRWYIGIDFIAQQGDFYSDIELIKKNRTFSF